MASYAMKQYCIAFDVGKNPDPSAIQVWKEVQIMEPATHSTPARQILKDDLIMQYRLYDKRHTATAHFIGDLMRREELIENAILVFDSTGVGEAMKDCLWEYEGIRNMIPIKYTAGDKERPVYKASEADPRFSASMREGFVQMKYLDYITVPKNMMVEQAQRAMELGEIRLAPNLPYKDEFKIQMQAFTGKMNKKGYTSYNNDTDKTHDDWVNCFMMRSWYRNRYRKMITEANREYSRNDEVADILGRGSDDESSGGGPWLR
nr:MAG TPA: terminase large subunit [Caudoviricetes sp.]